MSSALPTWLNELARQYYAGRTCLFLLYGNIHDHVWHEGKAYPFRHFLQEVVFRRRNLVLTYNRATGLAYRDEKTRQDFELFCRQVLERPAPPRLPGETLPLLHHYFQRRLSEGHRIAFIVEFTETLIPATGTAQGAEERATLLYFLRWAQDPLFLRSDLTILLLSESLSELHPKLVGNPHVSAIRVPYPDEGTRKAFIQAFMEQTPLEGKLTPAPSPTSLAVALGGLTLVQIEKLLSEIAHSAVPWTEADLLERKKMLVEAHAGGLVEFMSTHLTLDAVAGHHAAKAYLRTIAQALRAGHTAVIPMGFLVTGPVGTGKTFLLRCFAGEIGVPMVQLKNFRSPWVGETEANLERILALLEALAPIAVVIDEADTQLGSRERGGDSGVSARVFGKLASFMSDPRHRGRILWFLLTARPDLLPVDFKRQGRAEEHIPLFPPTTPQEKEEFARALAARLGFPSLEVPPDRWKDLPNFSGAEWEAIFTRARLQAFLHGQEAPSWSDIEAVLQDFLPPTYPEEIEYMTLLAVLECTRRSFLPPLYRDIDRPTLTGRLQELRTILGII